MIMIPIKSRESRRAKALKIPKKFERLYKEGKCRECAVVVTRMNFAKILGKFTKVKIQYESGLNSKPKSNPGKISPPSNTRLKRNENGMVLIHRNAYSEHPVKQLLGSKKSKLNDLSTPKQANNILKENNRLKKPILKDNNSNYEKTSKEIDTDIKQYGIVFIDPKMINYKDKLNEISLTDLLPVIDNNILPSEEWCIDYFPKNDEPKEDKVYDRIAAELEDLMYNEKPEVKTKVTEPKPDDFPSIMDILNDNTTDNNQKSSEQSASQEFKTNLNSSDVEAMLLGKSNPASKPLDSTPMEVDNAEISNIMGDVDHLNTIENSIEDKPQDRMETEEMDNNPQSPSILDEALQKGIEEHLPVLCKNNTELPKETTAVSEIATNTFLVNTDLQNDNILKADNKGNTLLPKVGISEVVFKQTRDGVCYKTVTCPKNLKYSIELEGKSVEFLGAPKFISSLDDLQVLLQIVNESELDSLYVH